jgi:hypothetical protein
MSKADISKISDTPNVNQYIPQLQGTITEKLETPRRKLSPNDKTLTTRRKRLLEAHASSPQFKINPKNKINSSPVGTESQKTSGTSDKKSSLKNSLSSKHSDNKGINECSSDEDSVVVSVNSDSSDDDLEDLMPTKLREAIEKQLIQPSTRAKRADFFRQEEKETAAVKKARKSKYAMDFAAGGLNQLTSFGIGGYATIGTGNPWVFPFAIPIMSEFIGDKIAQLTRTSTIVIPETQQWFAIQRQLGYAIGDLFVACANKELKKKFEIKVNGEIKKVTAARALKHMGLSGVAKAWARNFAVRGLPFAWFSLLYGIRDWQLNDAHGGLFAANATKWCLSHTPDANCTNVEQLPSDIDPLALRTSIVFGVGMLAGAATSLTGQAIASQMTGAVEKPNFSTDYHVKKMAYLESLKLDIKKFIDTLNPTSTDYENKYSAATDLEKSIDKDISYTKKKSSLWTTYQAEVDLATQKKRDSTMVTPEFGSRRVDSIITMIGKMLSLLPYVGFLLANLEKPLGQILIPLALIFIAGYAFRDDLRVIPELIYGAGKGIVRALKPSARDTHKDEKFSEEVNDEVVDVQGALGSINGSEEGKEAYLSNGNNNPDGTPNYNDTNRVSSKKLGERRLPNDHETNSDNVDSDGDVLT